MTKTELVDLNTAIELISQLRQETQRGFTELRTDIGDVKDKQTQHIAQHEAQEKSDAKALSRNRWAIGIVLASLGSLVTATLALLKTLQAI